MGKQMRDDRRGSSTERGYGSRWQKARVSFLKSHPLCVHCQERELLIPASRVDHITPHNGDQELFWDHDNWQALCESCHNRKTAREDGGFGNKGNGKVGAECRADGLPLDSRHHWNKGA